MSHELRDELLMYENIRTFWTNPILEDKSKLLTDVMARSLVFANTSSDYLYIASEVPFNHMFFEVESANAISSSVVIELWDGTDWIQAVDVIDETSTNGVSLSESGIIRFVRDREETWAFEQDSFEIPELASTKIYSKYWSRWSWSDDLTGTTELSYIGHRFCDQKDLYLHYPSLDSQTMRDLFETGKSSWARELVKGSEAMVRDLKRRHRLIKPEQILDYGLYADAAAHATAELIFAAQGQGFVDDATRARTAYKKAIDMVYAGIDVNMSGNMERAEHAFRQNWMTR